MLKKRKTHIEKHSVKSKHSDERKNATLIEAIEFLKSARSYLVVAVNDDSGAHTLILAQKPSDVFTITEAARSTCTEACKKLLD